MSLHTFPFDGFFRRFEIILLTRNYCVVVRYLHRIILLLQLIDRTCMSPTLTLEQHLMWDDIAILLRYLLMLSFNNSLDGRCL